jgi:hypothetical protein
VQVAGIIIFAITDKDNTAPVYTTYADTETRGISGQWAPKLEKVGDAVVGYYSGAFLIIVAFDHLIVSTIGRAQYVIARGCLRSCNACVPTAQCAPTTTTSHHRSGCLRSCTQSRIRAYTRHGTHALALVHCIKHPHSHDDESDKLSHTCTIHHPIHVHVVTLVMNTDWNDAATHFAGLSTACLRV